MDKSLPEIIVALRRGLTLLALRIEFGIGSVVAPDAVIAGRFAYLASECRRFGLASLNVEGDLQQLPLSSATIVPAASELGGAYGVSSVMSRTGPGGKR